MFGIRQLIGSPPLTWAETSLGRNRTQIGLSHTGTMTCKTRNNGQSAPSSSCTHLTYSRPCLTASMKAKRLSSTEADRKFASLQEHSAPDSEEAMSVETERQPATIDQTRNLVFKKRAFERSRAQPGLVCSSDCGPIDQIPCLQRNNVEVWSYQRAHFLTAECLAPPRSLLREASV